MFFLFSTPGLDKNLLQLKTAVFLHWCLLRAVPLDLNEVGTFKSSSMLIYEVTKKIFITKMPMLIKRGMKQT